MKIPFTKTHGARNDFLLTWRRDVPEGDPAEMARAICDRHTGIGADGWMIVTPPVDGDADGAVQLFNSDGSIAEMSGNGTRCAAAFLVRQGYAAGLVRVHTGAGLKHLRLRKRGGLQFEFEMNMGRPDVLALRHKVGLTSGAREGVLLWVGNPQCAYIVPDFDFDWRAVGAETERHPDFPNRTNVSFVRVTGPHSIDVRFWERGAGETMSSGTGSTGAAAAAIALGLVASPVDVSTPAGILPIRVDSEYHLVGPAEIVAEGEFFM